MPAPLAPRPVEVRQWREGACRTLSDIVSHEIPVVVRWNGGNCRLWAWPQDLEELVLGHVLLDRLHEGPADAPSPAGPRSGRVLLEDGVYRVELESAGARQGCTGQEGDPGSMSAAGLLETMRSFMGAEGLWDGTGCFHRAGVYAVSEGKVLRRVEDIGRHNCIDRLAGWAARSGVDLGATVLLVSARVTASLFAKARRAGFRWIVSRSAVTTASVDMALAQGVTLVGFARDREERFTIFADAAGRIDA